MSKYAQTWSRRDGQTDVRSAGQTRNEHPTSFRDVQAQLLELDCDPIAGMAKLATDESLPAALRARMFAELATYIAPRRKAVELSGPNGGPIETDCNFDYTVLSDSELKTLTVLLDKATGRGRT
jgi:hypothetical protein